MAWTPTDVANLALDKAGVDFTLGDLEEGTRQAQVCLRAYGTCLRNLLRKAHWDFARRQTPLALLGDASGQTQGVRQYAPVPWIYVYAQPPDCQMVRFIPSNPYVQTGVPIPQGNISINASVPLMGGLAPNPIAGSRLVPSRFLLTNDPNFPAPAGSNWWEVRGQSPEGSMVICSNVTKASIVYTATVPYPNMWDSLFYEAFVAYLASEIAVPLAQDKKFGMARQNQQIAIANARLDDARASNGNESWSSSDLSVDWIRVRNSGGWGINRWGDNAGGGVLGFGWEGGSLGGVGNSSAY
jgi:hypothetical protein